MSSYRARRLYRNAYAKRALRDQDFRRNTSLLYRHAYVNMLLAQVRKPRSFHTNR